MHQIKMKLKPLPFALACLLAAPVPAALAANTGASANASVSIPLDLIQENYGGGQYGYRLGINVGVNGATPEEYLFDTGSDSFNIDVGTGGNGKGPAWFPNQPGVAQSAPFAYLYGNGTYGYWEAGTTVASIQFYNSATGGKAASFDTSGGLPVAIATDWMVTPASAGGDTLGPPVTTIPGIGTLYQDLTWQQNLNAGQPPEEGYFYGTFGAGDFGTGVPGMLTGTGYIVEANGTGKAPGACGQACLIVGLNPALRAQFLSVVPWIPTQGQTTPFPLSGAPSAYQFDTAFLYTLTSNGKSVSAPMMTLFDTGTPNIMLIDNGDLGLQSGEQSAGNINQYGDLVPGITLTATGLAVNANGVITGISGLPTSITSGNDSAGDYSNVVTIGPYGGFPDSAIYGISFFMHNAVMYDLQNQATGYTPFFVTQAPITTGFTVTPEMGPLGLAGTISGSGAFQVASGGIADLSGTNTYTGATDVAQGAWMALAGPGSIAQSSDVHVDGTFDVSRTWQPTNVQSLSGGGTVLLGGTTLDLTRAGGTFSGQIADGGIGGGSGGRLMISAGTETLSGNSTFTGPTGISAPGSLDLTGSLAGSVVNLGSLLDDGQIGGTVLDDGLLFGNGAIAGNLDVNGIVAPGNGAGSLQTLKVGGNYVQQAGASYLVQIAPSQSAASLLQVGGTATLDAGAKVGVTAVQSGIYRIGARYTVLDAAHGLTGTYALGDSALSAVLGIAPGYDADHVYLNVVQERPLTAITGTRNQTSTLAGLQGVPASSYVLSAVASLPTDGAIRAAADQLSGEVHATTQGALLESSRYLRDAVTARLRQAGEGAAGGPAVTQGAGALTWWGQFVGAWGHHDGDDNAASARQTTNGVLLGADRALGGDARLGAVAGYSQTAVNIGARASSTSSRNLDLGVYAGTGFGKFGLRGGVAYTWHKLASNRYIAVPGLAGHAFGDYSASTAQVFGEAAYRAMFKRTSVEPFLRASWVRLDSDAFQEYGDAAALSGAGDHQSVAFTTLGTRMATQFAPARGGMLTLHETLGWRHAFNRVDTDAALAFAQGPAFDVAGLPIARNALDAGIGLTLHVAKDASFDLSYQGQFARHAVDNEFEGRFDWRF